MRKMWNCESKAVNFFKTSQMDLNWVRGFNQQREQFELTAKLSDLVSADIKSPVKLSELLNRFKGQLSFLKSKLDRLPGKASAEQLAYSSQLGKIISEIEKNSQKIGTELTKFLKSLPPEKSLMAKIGEGLLAVPLAIFSAGCTPTNKPALTEKEQMVLGGLVMMGQANRQNTGAGQTPSTTPVTVPSQPTDTPLITPATPAATVTPPVTPVTPVDITFPPNPVTYRLDNQGRKVSAMIRHYVNGEPRMAVLL
jgi:hypothetical protein